MKKIITAFIILTVFFSLAISYHKVFSFKYGDGIYGLTAFYELEKNSVDVLILGSSHAFQSINPAVFWKEKKIRAFDLCGSVQPMWNTYYYLLEAMKTQKPKLVVLEAYCLVNDIQYIDDSRIIKNVAGMKWSWDKIDALKVSAPKKRWTEFGLEYIQYHNRYKDLQKDDFIPYMGESAQYKNFKGNGNNFIVTPCNKPIVHNTHDCFPLSKKQGEYYNKIIDYCNQNNIQLLIIVSPYSGYEKRCQNVFNEAARVANSKNVKFINFNEYYDAMGLDWKTDSSDISHLSYEGNHKFTKFLIEYIMKKYNLTSSKNISETSYYSWEKNAEFDTAEGFDDKMRKTSNIDVYFSKLKALDKNYIVLLSKKGVKIVNNMSLNSLFAFWKIKNLSDKFTYTWTIEQDVATLHQKSKYGYNYMQKFSDGELLMDKDGIYYNKQNYEIMNDGVNIIIYDKITQKIADAVGIDNTGMKHRQWQRQISIR